MPMHTKLPRLRAAALSGRGIRALLLAAAAPVALAACAPVTPPTTSVLPSTSDRADVNQPRQPMGLPGTTGGTTASLAEMQELRGSTRRAETAEADRLRGAALRDNALSYGAQGGLAWASKEINSMLERQASNLGQTWDFNRMLIRQPGGVAVLPPVISEGRDTYEQSDAGRTLRVADRYYEIVDQARFAPTAPLWQEYLVRNFTPPRTPPADILPKDDAERELWRRYVAEGWAEGEKQAREIFRLDLARLERDHTGMIRYSELLERGQVSAPVVASQALGTTGSGQNMRVGDTVNRITRDPRLNVQRPSEWQALPSNTDATTAATPPGDAPGVRNR